MSRIFQIVVYSLLVATLLQCGIGLGPYPLPATNPTTPVAAAPTVTSVSPTLGFGAVALTITGTDFVTGATVTVGGNACSSPTVVSSTSITCTTATHSPGEVDVVVTNSDSQASTLSNAFYFDATLLGPFAGLSLTAVKDLSDDTLGDNESNLDGDLYTEKNPYSAKTLTIDSSNNLTWDTTGPTVIFLRGQTIGTSGAATVSVNGEAGENESGPINAGDGGLGASGGGGGSVPNGAAGDGGDAGADGAAGTGDEIGVAGTGTFSRASLSLSYDYGSGGAGGDGGTAVVAGGTGGLATRGAGGGGGGGGQNSNPDPPGGGGGGAGLLVLVAHELSSSINLTLLANGGNGGAGWGSGGGGGGGGLIWIALWTYSGQLSGKATATGGTGGTSTISTVGSNGSNGTVSIFQINADGSLTAKALTDSW